MVFHFFTKERQCAEIKRNEINNQWQKTDRTIFILELAITSNSNWFVDQHRHFSEKQTRMIHASVSSTIFLGFRKLIMLQLRQLLLLLPSLCCHLSWTSPVSSIHSESCRDDASHVQVVTNFQIEIKHDQFGWWRNNEEKLKRKIER